MRFRRQTAPRVAIDIAPMVDVVFLLIIFFAASTTFLESSGMELELPTSSASAERQQQELTVSVGLDGKIEFDGEIVTGEVLQERLEAALADREDKLVVLRADTTVEHGSVVEVMDRIRQAGAEGLTVATRAEPAGDR